MVVFVSLCVFLIGVASATDFRVDLLLVDENITTKDISKLVSIIESQGLKNNVVINISLIDLRWKELLQVKMATYAEERAERFDESLSLVVVKCKPVPEFSGLGLVMYSLSIPCSDREYTLTNVVSATEQSLLISEVIRRLHWIDFMMIYSKENARVADLVTQHVDTAPSQLLLSSHPELTDHILKYIDNQTANNYQPANIILLCDQSRISQIFQQVNDLSDTLQQGAVEYNSRWILVGGSPATVMQNSGNILNILQLATKDKQWNDVDQQTTALLRSQQIHKNDHGSKASNQTDKTCKITLCKSCGELPRGKSPVGVEIDIFSSSVTDSNMVQIGSYHNGSITNSSEVRFINSNCGFCGKRLLVGIMPWIKFVEKIVNSSGIFYEGYCLEILQQMSTNLNFSYTIIEPEDQKWGDRLEGNWTGLVGQLERQEVDMTMAPLAIYRERQEVMDYAHAFYIEYHAVLVAKVDPERLKWRLFAQPFKWQVWLCVMLSVPFIATITWSMTRASPYYRRHMKRNGLRDFSNSLLYAYGSLLFQGGQHLPRAQSGRFVIGFWWMFCLVVVATYSGNLIAFLAVTKETLPFSTLEDMALQTGLKFGVQKSTIIETMLQGARTDPYRALWRRIKEFNMTDPGVLSGDNSVHLNRVLQGGYGYINDKTGFDNHIDNHCNLTILKERMSPVEYAPGLQKNSYYVKFISDEIVKAEENGLLEKWKTKWWQSESRCSRGILTEAKAVTLADMQGAYYLLAIMFFVALVSFFGEFTFLILKNNLWKKEKSL